MKNNLLLLLLCIVSVSCSNGSTIIENGNLPKRYEWAYGEWRAESSKYGEINLIIGEDFIQYNYPFCATFNEATGRTIKSDELPSIECFPKMTYSLYSGYGGIFSPEEDNGQILIDSNIYFDFLQTFLKIYIDRKKKTIKNENGDTFSKVKAKKNADDALAMYEAKLDNSPLGGDWRQNNSRRIIKLLQNPNHTIYIVSNNGKILISRSAVYELDNNGRLKELRLDNSKTVAKYYRNVRSSQQDKYLSSNVVFNHEQDVFLYLTGHKFYNTDNKHTLSFTSSLELVVDGVMLTGAMRTVAFNQEEALLLGHCPQGGDIKLGVYGKLHCVVDATEKPYVAYSEQ